MREEPIDCRELVGIAIAKRATGRNWRHVRDDILFYLKGRGVVPKITGEDADYQLVFSNGQVFYHRSTGEYGFDYPGGEPKPDAGRKRSLLKVNKLQSADQTDQQN